MRRAVIKRDPMRAEGSCRIVSGFPADGVSGDNTRPTESRTIPGLVWTLIRTDFKTRYHGTIGGFVWALLKPLTMFLVLLAVFSYVFASEPQYKLDLIIGLFLYEFFQESTKAGLLSIRAKGYLLTKARFPPWIVVVTSASNAVITLALFSLVLVTVPDGDRAALRRPRPSRFTRCIRCCSSRWSRDFRSPPACCS